MTANDLDLLQEYSRDGSEAAFAELVRRHLNLVYSAALRQVRSPQLAEEVAQSAFTDLAQSAAKLAPDTILTAWLYQVSHRTAIDVVRREARRQLREQVATEMNSMNATDADWENIEPLLDEAMHALDETDRTAVLLRYFEKKSLREVGAALGTSDDAAQKRISRAVDQLREFLAKRGVAVGVGALAATISVNAVHAAPAALFTAIATSVTTSGAALAGATTTTAAKTFAMTTFTKTLAAVAIIGAIGIGIHQAQRAAQLRGELDAVQQTQSSIASSNEESLASLRAQLDSLSNQNTDLSRGLAQANADKARIEAEREQARHSAAIFKELADQATSHDKSMTNEYPTSRHVMVGMGRLARKTVQLTNEDTSTLSSEAKSAHDLLKMNLALDWINAVKAAQQFENLQPPGTKDDTADSGACLLYGALNLDEQQFGRVYSLLQQYNQQVDSLNSASDHGTADNLAAIKHLEDQLKTDLHSTFTPDQTKLFDQILPNLHLKDADSNGSFSFKFGD